MERADIKLAIDMLAGMEDDAQIAAHCIGTLEDCGNEIAHLRAKVAELEAQLAKYQNLEPVAWVSTLDRLPPDETVVIAVVNGRIRLAERRWEYPTYEETFKAFWYWDDPSNDGQDWGIADVTHWMPIPLYALEK